MRDTDATDAAEPTPGAATSRDTERDLPHASRGPSGPPDATAASTTLTSSTLLSVEPDTERGSERPDPRVEELDRRVAQLEARVKVLELQRGAAGALADKRWLFWVGLLLALLLGWQLRAFLR